MTMDNKVVQPEAVPAGTTPAPAAQATTQATTPTPAPAPEPSPEEKMAALIQKAVSAEVAKTTEAAKREIQSVKDRARAEVEAATRRAKMVEGTLGTAKAKLHELAPEASTEIELAELRARDAARSAAEQEEAVRSQQTAFHDKFYGGLTELVTNLGIDPKDTRIDWGLDAGDYLDAMKRVNASVSKIQQESIKTLQTANKGYEDRLKALETKVGQVNTEVNSVNTTTSQGVVAGSDAEFIKKLASGELPMTKANKERYDKILSAQ